MGHLRVEVDDIRRISDRTLLYFGSDVRAKLSRFWILLTLSGVIAAAGIWADSPATVIGAMIIAPLMTPILGIAFSLVISDRWHLLRSLLTLLGGALLIIAIGFFFGLFEPLETIAEDNSQVSSRVRPRLVDLVAALATGAVGMFAMVRSDVSDTLPGVAISISLVPPLAVAGLTLEEGRTDEALGALLLFMTNVSAMLMTATLGLWLYKLRETAIEAGREVGEPLRKSVVVVIGIVVLVTIPLAYTSRQLYLDTNVKFNAAPLAEAWAESNGWKLIGYQVYRGEIQLTALGPPPKIEPASLRSQLDAAGLSNINLEVKLVVGDTAYLPATQ